ncbi:hypothetical protein [Terribacillus saccharophilus]|uniref:hypothetical protein n=1 Tax=Terribacillus saccharophilus TaxID=361277 RepID=UPI002989B407|nr:hypothetical protein [Terribacillus saccharophilus]MCM3227512.1 hypothetical protein [Terribacillus saccharophilus]
MRIFTAESLKVFYSQDDDLFENITGINLDNYSGHEIITLENEHVAKLKEKGVFDQNV